MMMRPYALLLLPLLASGPALHSFREGKVTAVTLSSSGASTKLEIAVTSRVGIREFTMHGPDRLVLDLSPARKGDLPANDSQRRGNVTGVRVSQFSDSVVRVVVQFDRLPTYTLDRGTGSVISVTFPSDSTASAGVAVSDASIDATAAPVATLIPGTADSVTEAKRLAQMFGMQSQDFEHMNVMFNNTPIMDALNAFATYAHRSIVAGRSVVSTVQTVSMTINDQPWPYAFRAFLAAEGLQATEMQGGIIRVDVPSELSKQDSTDVLEIRAIRLNYQKAGDMAKNVERMLTKPRGYAIADTSTNTLILGETRSRIDNIEQFIRGLDIKTLTVAIESKLVFVDRTNLQQLGLKYDVGTSDQFFNKIVQRQDPLTGQPYNPNTNVVSLGGNTISAISNADAVISGSALDLVFSTAIGGFSISAFLSALERVDLTDVEAQPTVHTLDNRQAFLLSGEQTPVRIIDASSFGQVNQAPRATVQFKETGIKLTGTPHVTADRHIQLDLDVERSSVQPLAAADLGFIIPIQHTINKLLVNDGETAVMSGLTVTTVTRNRQSIPFLGAIPFLGQLFSYTTNQERRQDLIILVTPRILDDH